MLNLIKSIKPKLLSSIKPGLEQFILIYNLKAHIYAHVKNPKKSYNKKGCALKHC